MRACPKCGEFYADDLLAFCLTDGTPLVGVIPHGEYWSDAVRLVEEKEQALRKQRRRLRWRRVVQSATTMLVTTLVICVVAVNGLIYLTAEPVEVPRDVPSRSAPSPVASPVTVLSRLRELIPTTQSIPTLVEPLPTPQTTAATNPTGAPTSTATLTPADDTRPTTTTPTPTPTPTRTLPPMPPFPSTPLQPECTDADKGREREAIVNGFGGRWRQKIEGDRQKIIAEYAPDGAVGTEASLGEIEYASLFSACTASVITARYTWQVRANVNGTIKNLNVTKSKRFTCVKLGGAWLCR